MAETAAPAERSGSIPGGATIVLDASTMVDLLLDAEASVAIRSAVRGRRVAVPSHFDAEVLSAIGRLHRAGDLTDSAATVRVERLAGAPFEREPLTPLLAGAWARRAHTRLADGLYLELAASLDTVVLTTDRRLARAHPALAVVPENLP
jgi:predicted nucleic acid-binding protein